MESIMGLNVPVAVPRAHSSHRKIPRSHSTHWWIPWILLQLSSGGVIEPRYALMINMHLVFSILKLIEPFISNETTKDAKPLPDAYLFSSGILSGGW
jgi:hypothetical protein